MAPIAKEPDALRSSQGNTEAATPTGIKPQAAAAEIPVTVNGARTVEGSDKREPFSENTQTVLVFANGAVIRLSSTVASGQLLFLTNEKTKKEVVCQVVKSKNYSSASGYVELEFTEAAPGFWGLRFPGSLPAQNSAQLSKPLVTTSAPAMKSLGEQLAEVSTKTPPMSAASSHKAPDSAPTPAADLSRQTVIPPAPPAVRGSADGTVIPGQPPAIASKIPTLSEFLTQGTAGPSLKTREKANTELSKSKPEASIQGLKQQTAEIQNQLSSKLFTPEPTKQSGTPGTTGASTRSAEAGKSAQAPDKRGTLSSVLLPTLAKENPAPGSSTFDFEAEEIKIPAWLEPLARNSATNSPMQEIKPAITHDLITKALEAKSDESQSIDAAFSSSLIDEATKLESACPEHIAEAPGQHAAAVTLSGEGPTPNFGSSLTFGGESTETAGSPIGSGKGLIFGLLAAGLLLAAGGGWYWYLNQPKDASANETTATPTNSGTSAANAPSHSSSTASSSEFAKSNSPASSPNVDANLNATYPQSVRADNRGSGNATNGFSKPAAATGRVDASAAPATQPSAEPMAPPPAEPVKKPSLGKVHLAAPVVGRRDLAPNNNVADLEPALGGNGATTGDSGSFNMLASKSNQPVAPIPVGGDVKAARLLSSVSPAYPQLARTQRLSGDIKIDALIDVNGRVSAMKVISGPALLHQAAMDALRQWKYQPATLNGQPMAMHLTVTVQFKLR
jgi:protein TonB